MESHAVSAFDGSLARLVDDLFETLYATAAVGWCVPQVVVADLRMMHRHRDVYVNPELLSRAGLGLVEESCLVVWSVTAAAADSCP